VAEQYNIGIPEFTVSGIKSDSLFGHHWFLGTDTRIPAEEALALIDNHLKTLNDDYATERSHALRELKIDILPLEVFHKWMEKHGKLGGQHKFPRVSKNAQLEDWLQHVNEYKSLHPAPKVLNN
jgi:hypothetical protein